MLKNPEGVKSFQQIKEKQQDSDKITNTKKKTDQFQHFTRAQPCWLWRKGEQTFYSPSSPPNITVTARGEESSRNTSRDIYRPTSTWPSVLVEHSGDEWKKKFRKSTVESLEMRLERWTSPGIDKQRLVRGLETNQSLPLSSVPFPGNFKRLLLLQC